MRGSHVLCCAASTCGLQTAYLLFRVAPLQKDSTRRSARASCVVRLGPVAFPLVQENRGKKGDVLSVAQIAGIMAAKNTANLIPLCHNIPLSKVCVSRPQTLYTGANHIDAT